MITTKIAINEDINDDNRVWNKENKENKRNKKDQRKKTKEKSN